MRRTSPILQWSLSPALAVRGQTFPPTWPQLREATGFAAWQSTAAMKRALVTTTAPTTIPSMRAMIGMQATTSCSCPTVRKNSSTLLPQTLIMSLLFTTVQTLSRWVGSRITPRSKAFCSVPAPVSLALRALAASFLVRSAPLDVPLIPMLRI